MILRSSEFEQRIRMTLVLLALALGVADVANFLLLRSALSTLEEREALLAGEAAGRVARELDPGAITRAMADPARTALEFPPTRLRGVAERQGVLEVDLVSTEGMWLASGSPARLGDRDPFVAAYTSEDEWHPASGQAWWKGPVNIEGQPSLVYYAPLRGGDGLSLGSLRVAVPAPGLAALRRGFFLLAWGQAIVLIAAAAVSFGLSRWITRPWRLMAQAVEEADREAAGTDDSPDALVASFRGVVDKLRRQEEELRRLTAPGRPARGEGGEADPVAAFLRTVGASLASGVLAVDRDERIAGLNDAASALLFEGAGAGAVGRSLESALRASDDLVALIRSVLRGAGARSRELVSYRAASGAAGTLGVSASPVAPQGNWPGGVFCLVSDLSEIAALRERERLREGLASVGELSAGIAHEYRNSLATILGYARLVEREAPGSPVSGYAEAIAREVLSVRAAVDDFLRFARPARLSRAPVDLRALCAAAAADLRRDGAMERLRVEIPPEMPPVLADEAALRQAIGNLLRNAAESDPGREVTVRMTARPDPGGRTVRLQLADDGPGIPAEHREKIFLPFFTTKSSGTGLGLAIAQRTILEHDGAIEVSGDGTGATFEIQLPAAEPVSFRNSEAEGR